MTTVIVALGGSLLRPEIEERHTWLEGLVSIIRERVSMNDRIGIVVGGGAPTREGIELARSARHRRIYFARCVFWVWVALRVEHCLCGWYMTCIYVRFWDVPPGGRKRMRPEAN